MINSKIYMVDLKSQYHKIKEEVDEAILDVIASAQYIKGPAVKSFETNLATYLDVKHVIGCANGTDALQIALMALGLTSGDDVIVPAFTYVSTVEVISLLGLNPIMVDVDPNTFNITAEIIENALTPNTKAIVPVHLFGQSVDLGPIMELSNSNNLYVIEDNAQAIGADYKFPTGQLQKTGTIGDIGCTSFYPSKNLGAYGDGGAIFTNDETLAKKLSIIANHGQTKRYYHDIIGCNSRLDSIQAAILNIKLKYLDEFSRLRRQVADNYDKAFENIEEIQTPKRQHNSSHVFHQYTLIIKDGRREALKKYLLSFNIPYGVFYPLPLYKQKAFSQYMPTDMRLVNSERLCDSVLSLPIHPDMQPKVQDYIIEKIADFFRKH